MPTPDMEFKAVYDAATDTNVCTAILQLGRRELVKSEDLEGDAAEVTKTQMRGRLAGQLIDWMKEHAPEILHAHTISSWAVEFSLLKEAREIEDAKGGNVS